jgi:fatty acid desaturase
MKDHLKAMKYLAILLAWMAVGMAVVVGSLLLLALIIASVPAWVYFVFWPTVFLAALYWSILDFIREQREHDEEWAALRADLAGVDAEAFR